MEAATSQERDWSSLPVDLLAQILRWIKWSNHPSFGLVCRQWRSAVSPFYPAWITPVLLNAANLGTTNIRYYSPYYHKNFEVATTLEAPGAKIYCATGPHLVLGLMHKVLSIELGTGAVTVLPPIARTKFDFVVYDGVGKISGFNTLGGVVVSLSFKNSNGEWDEWENYDVIDVDPDVPPQFMMSSVCNPVLHGGLLYLLGEDETLAVFDYDKSSHEQRFEILKKPHGFGFKSEDSYLVESDQGDIMAILIGHRGTPVNVVKLNEHTMEWEKMENLGGRALFTGTLTTIVKKTNIKWMQNKVFIPRLRDWPETVHVDLDQRDGEFAFVPKLGCVDITVKGSNSVANMWSYELGRHEEASEFWGTERVDYSIWVDFSTE